MTKTELIARIAELYPLLQLRDAERAVNAIFDELNAALSRGQRVEIRGFGTFTVKKREARIGRNPKTGEAVSVGERYFPLFRAGKDMRLRLNAGA